MTDFYARLSYSFGNEDWRTEHKALQIQPDNRVICVTASGDRPLNLLAFPCQGITAIDANPIQNALLDLKRAAISHLTYPEYLKFLGLEKCSKRLSTLRELEYLLEARSLKFWEAHQKKIEKGVLFQGELEKKCRIAAQLIRLFRGSKMSRLFEFDSLEKQQAFVEKAIDTPIWKRLFYTCTNPHLLPFFINDPGLYKYVDANIHSGKYLYERLHSSLKRFLAKESILISLLFKGNVSKEHHPFYLSEEGFHCLKERLHLLTFETANVVDYIEALPENSVDRFSLSDVASYIPFSEFERLIKAICRSAKPGARFCLRQFMSDYHIPQAIEKTFKRERELESQLEQEERCFVYRFMIGSIVKDPSPVYKDQQAPKKDDEALEDACHILQQTH